MRPNSINVRYHPQPLVSGIPGAFSWILSVLLAVILSWPFANLLTAVRPTPHSAPVNAPIQVEARIPTVGQDRNHRSLPFTVYVLSQEFSWKLESTDELEAERTLLNPELIASIHRAPETFCVGTASYEGGTRTEEARAARRAATLAQWVGAAIRSPAASPGGSPGQTHLITLNAGQYKGPRQVESSYQRKAVILVTGPHDDRVDLGQGLKSGLEQQEKTYPVVHALLHEYSRSKEWLNLRGSGGALHEFVK